MNSADASVIDLLLTNLPEHRVIRLQGTLQWCESVRQRLSVMAGYSLEVIQGQIGLADLQPKLQRGSSSSRIIWLDPESIDRDACTFLAEFLRKAHDGQVRVVIVSSPELNSVLDSLPRDSALLVDGIYQQELEIGRGGGQNKIPLWLGAGVFLALAGFSGWYFMQPTVPASNTGTVTMPNPLVSPATPKAPVTKKETGTLNKQSPDSSPAVVEKTQFAAEPAKPVSGLELSEQEHEVEPSSSVEARRSVIDLYESVLLSSAAKASDLSEEPPVDGENEHKSTETAVVETSPEVAESIDKASELPEQVRAEPAEEIAAAVKVPEMSPVGHVAPEENRSVQPPAGIAQIISDYSVNPAAVSLPETELERIMATVDQWATGWSEQNWERYIGSYITKPHGIPMPLAEWREFRKQRLLEPEWLKLTFGKPTLTVHDTHWVKVELYQRFEKPGYADETTKRLAMQKTAEGWKIASEATDGTVVLSR